MKIFSFIGYKSMNNFDGKTGDTQREYKETTEKGIVSQESPHAGKTGQGHS